MACTWNIVLNDQPTLEHYPTLYPPNSTDLEEGTHTYLTSAFLTPTHSIPGIPSAYAIEQIQGRALYLGGAPKGWQSDTVRSIFQLYGLVEKIPVLISVSAEETFRWVIMESSAQAKEAMKMLHGRKLENGCLSISESLPPGRTITLVGKELLEHQPEEILQLSWEDEEKTPVQELFHGHPPVLDTSEEKTPTVNTFEFMVEDTDAEQSFNAEIYSPAIPQPSQASPAKSTSKESEVNDENVKPPTISWANITASAASGTKLIDLKPERAAPARLRPVGRIPSITRTNAGDTARLVFLFNLPSNITIADVSNAVKEGPLIKMHFGIDDTTKKRFCGVVFQHSRDAAAFIESLDKEKRLSRPERFRFIVEHARAEQDGLEEALKVMGAPVFATRRLTIVKAGFFFMFGERQLKDMCIKLVGEDLIQLIWLYNGGNATVVFTDVSAAVKVKNEFDRRAFRAVSGGEGTFAIWAGVSTTFSKDPCVVPLELRTAMQTSRS